MSNTLYYGDNLDVLRHEVKSESADLIYLDPPFNSGQDYNVIYKDKTGKSSETQRMAFEDTWEWGDKAEAAYEETVRGGGKAGLALEALFRILGTNDLMAYLCMMAPRLVELQRVLKPTGSIYLHCDPTASHYLKVLMDAIFGGENFRNEVIWKRTSAHNDPTRYGANIDILLFYAKSGKYTWNKVYLPHEPAYVEWFRNRDSDGRRWADDNLTAKGLSGGGYKYRYKGVTSLWRCPVGTMKRLDAEGRLHFTRAGGIRLKRYLDENKGAPLQAVWDDIPPINSQAQERLGYPTQKPAALLERILTVSSNEGDTVLDPFCGCGTTVAVAQKMKRRWIGIDITYLALAVIENRLRTQLKLRRGAEKPWTVGGVPREPEALLRLAHENAYGFQDCIMYYLKGRPLKDEERKRGGDEGIDGELVFFEGKGMKTSNRRVIVSVKSGEHANPAWVRDLRGVLDREQSRGAVIGCLVTATPPTEGMKAEAAKAGYYKSPTWGNAGPYPRIQIVSAGELLDALRHGHHPVKYPAHADVTWPEAMREPEDVGEQLEVGL